MKKPPGARLVFLDLLRGWAILVMMETHVFNTLLDPSIKATWWFRYLTFFNGLVAPSFLFVSGWVFLAASRRKLDEFRQFGPAFRRQSGRILLIWGLGYALHLPFYSYSRTKACATSLDWLRFCQMDILHCIAAGLALLLMTRIFIKDDRALERILLTTGIGTVVLTPFLARIDFMNSMPAAVGLYLQEQSYSYFPLFPWVGFLLLGGFAAMAYQRWIANGKERNLMILFGLVGLEFVLAGIVFWELPGFIPYTSPRITVNPFFFGLRLGCVMLLLFGCWQYAQKWPDKAIHVREISRESLLVYVLHILIIYRLSRDNQSFSSAYGNSLTLWESTAFLAGLVFLMWPAARIWTSLKQWSLKRSRSMAYSAALLAILLFFLN